MLTLSCYFGCLQQEFEIFAPPNPARHQNKNETLASYGQICYSFGKPKAKAFSFSPIGGIFSSGQTYSKNGA